MADASICPRCERSFGCGAREATCWCREVTVAPAVLADLQRRFDTCLCGDCLRQLSTAGDALQDQ